jgi:hypothetical protein
MFEDGKALEDRAVVHDVEEVVGHIFPESYKNFVMGNDGASSEYGVDVFSKDRGRTVFVECSHFIPFVYDDPNLTMMDCNRPERTPHLEVGLVAFAEDGAGFLFCFDYRSSNEPSVVILTNNWIEEPVLHVADSFSDFWKVLRPYREDV